jgi:hypothetical protein
MTTQYHVQVNEGQIFIIELQTQSFAIAAVAALALVAYTPRDNGEIIKIWVKHPEVVIGPHYYVWHDSSVQQIPPPSY